MHDLHGATFVCSWSGGKDACLAMHRAVAAGGVPRALICLAREDGKTTLTHGIPVSLVQAQADSLHLPLEICPGSWHMYESVWAQALQRQVAAGVQAAVFGDLFITRHRDWERRVCHNLGLRPLNPLWRESSRALANELFATHTKAVITCLLAEKLDPSYLGREVTPALLNEIEAAGVDPFGEHGEYHTLVLDTDLFAESIEAAPVGRYLHDGYWYLDFGDGPPVGQTTPRPRTGGIQ
ncbi:MAG TPA: adenine nucleotide alpha hydrolase [Thermoleophilia bacterium]|nr:adenine nucleotide alpha hydrolase [Thermoleophilia bacterium]HQG03426.1 adenine nucleotide alpha hydrolase [Thermoleophilia bacterium]HQG54125.1 adenine nucleotide alpha hydrolase [Thermoleophilia bacterium]HQJ98696.1 adenine nucleotide alpha hydrolase [Thermoleophilia bacterium]